MDAYYDPEEYIVTTITIAAPVGPTATAHIVTITYGSNSSAAKSVTINAKVDQVWALDKAWMELWETAKYDEDADRALSPSKGTL